MVSSHVIHRSNEGTRVSSKPSQRQLSRPYSLHVDVVVRVLAANLLLGSLFAVVNFYSLSPARGRYRNTLETSSNSSHYVQLSRLTADVSEHDLPAGLLTSIYIYPNDRH